MFDSFVTPWTAAHQALSMGIFPGKITGVGCHFLLQGNLPDPGLTLGSLPLCYQGSPHPKKYLN